MTSLLTFEAVRTVPRHYALQAAGGILLGSKSGLRKPASLAHARFGTGYAIRLREVMQLRGSDVIGCWCWPYLMADAVDSHGPAAAYSLHDRLLTAGVPVISKPQQELWGLVEMWIADPDGVRIVLVEVPKDHPLRRDQR